MARTGEQSSKESDQAKTHGHIPGIAVGRTFKNRAECAQARVHAHLQAGIHGSAKDGAYSIVMSYGYEDDEDNGDTFIYSGEGGTESTSNMQGKKSWDVGRRNSDQKWTRGNNALLVSSRTKKPVRVVRGKSSNFFAKHAPEEGYRYDGLYQVEKAWESIGISGFITCKFFLTRLPNQPPLPAPQHQSLWKVASSIKSYVREPPVLSLPSLASNEIQSSGSSRESTPEPQSATSISRQFDSILELSEDKNHPPHHPSARNTNHAIASALPAAGPSKGFSQTADTVQITTSQNNPTGSESQVSNSQPPSWAEIQALLFPKNTAFKDLKFKKNKK